MNRRRERDQSRYSKKVEMYRRSVEITIHLSATVSICLSLYLSPSLPPPLSLLLSHTLSLPPSLSLSRFRSSLFFLAVFLSPLSFLAD